MSMYGQAGGSLEEDVAMKKKELEELQKKYKNEKSEEKRARIKKMMIETQNKMNDAKQKMKLLLRGIAKTTSKAASSLSDGMSSLALKLSAGINASKKNNQDKEIDEARKAADKKVRSNSKADKILGRIPSDTSSISSVSSVSSETPMSSEGLEYSSS